MDVKVAATLDFAKNYKLSRMAEIKKFVSRDVENGIIKHFAAFVDILCFLSPKRVKYTRFYSKWFDHLLLVTLHLGSHSNKLCHVVLNIA